MSTDLSAALVELQIRQAQMLNLEVRFFVLLLASQLVFYGHCAVSSLGHRAPLVEFAGAAAFTAILLIAIGTNAKMGLSATYLRQLESFIEANGGAGVVWERNVMPSWVFATGNAFTLAAGLAACIFLAEIYWVWLRFGSTATGNRPVGGVLAVIVSLTLAGLAIKAATVDFGKAPPEFFAKR